MTHKWKETDGPTQVNLELNIGPQAEGHNVHKHLLVTAIIQKPPSDPYFINTWLKDLVELVGMKVLMPPRAQYCDDIGNEGVSGDVVITTSHASIHLWDNLLQADLYSCREFDEFGVLEHIATSFDIKKMAYQVIDRSPERMIWSISPTH